MPPPTGVDIVWINQPAVGAFNISDWSTDVPMNSNDVLINLPNECAPVIHPGTTIVKAAGAAA